MDTIKKLVKSWFADAKCMEMVISPLFLLSKLSGMSLLSISNATGNKMYSISKKGLLFSIIAIGFYLYCIFYSLNAQEHWKYLSKDPIKFVGVILQIATGIVSVGAVYISGFTIGRIVPEWFKKVDGIDNALFSKNVCVLYHKLQALVYKYASECIFSILIFYYLQYIVSYDKTYLIYSQMYIYPFMNITLHTFRYSASLYILFERFHLINKELTKMTKHYNQNSAAQRYEEYITNLSKIKTLLDSIQDLCDLLKFTAYFHSTVDVITKLVIFLCTIFNLYFLIVTYFFFYEEMTIPLVCVVLWPTTVFQFLTLYFLAVAQSCVRMVSSFYVQHILS